ncbi:MAG: creatininase [Gemmatimonadales bacterium]
MTRTRRLSELTWPEVRDRAAGGAAVVVPVGSTEQHGYHLPLCTDVVLPEQLALAVAETVDVLVAPPIAYGYRSRPLSGGGEGFPGTISLSGRTLMSVLEDVLLGLARSGFSRVVVLNWHYENSNFVYEAARLAHDRWPGTPARVMVVEAAFAELSGEVIDNLFEGEFHGWDIEHAAILETSLMQHLRPHLVHFERAVDDRAARHPFYDVVPPPAEFIPTSGTLSTATRASAEKGALAWAEITRNLRQAVASELGVGTP